MQKEIKQFIPVTCILLLLCLPTAAQLRVITGKVVGISDGDTITVLDASNRQHKIRFNGIDAPEIGQPFGDKSKQSLSDLVFGKTVTVTSSKIDRYGRVVGKVTHDGKDIGLEQIKRGMAWFYRKYASELSRDDALAYERAEEAARSKKRGLWIDIGPIPPWELREAQREQESKSSPVTDGSIIGNRNSKVFHRPDCPAYNDVSERNRVYFRTVAEAEAAGYREAGNCPRGF